MQRPVELENLSEFEARLRAYAEHARSQYNAAEREYFRLQELHLAESKNEMDRWASEEHRAQLLLGVLRGLK